MKCLREQDSGSETIVSSYRITFCNNWKQQAQLFQYVYIYNSVCLLFLKGAWGTLKILRKCD